MPVTMTVYDISTALATLGGNPITVAEMDTVMADIDTTEVGTRPYNTTYGNWDDNQPVGFDVSEYENIAMVINYQLTIDEDTTYEFDIDSDDYGDIHIDGAIAVFEPAGSSTATITPLALTVGTKTLQLRFQNGTGAYSFAIRWRKIADSTFSPLDNTSVGLSLDNVGSTIHYYTTNNDFIDYPHKLTIKTQLDGEYVRRRVEIRDRISGTYVASKITTDDGLAVFTRLPYQTVDFPYIVTCFDDRESGYLNALVYDRIYQVNNQGFPP